MKVFFPLAATALLAGCAPTLAPHTPYLPTIRNRGEAELRVATGTSGTEAQLGYQVTDRLVLHTAALYQAGGNSGKNFRSLDLGLGYYRPSTNGRWRLGLHGGVATGRGFSGSNNFCLDLCSEIYSQFTVRYTYGYLQPTALFQYRKLSLGLGTRVGMAYYHQLDEAQFSILGGATARIDHASHKAAFVQPAVQVNFRVLPWLGISGGGGFQFYVGTRNRLNDLQPLMLQGGLNFIMPARAKDTP